MTRAIQILKESSDDYLGMNAYADLITSKNSLIAIDAVYKLQSLVRELEMLSELPKLYIHLEKCHSRLDYFNPDKKSLYYKEDFPPETHQEIQDTYNLIVEEIEELSKYISSIHDTTYVEVPLSVIEILS